MCHLNSDFKGFTLCFRTCQQRSNMYFPLCRDGKRSKPTHSSTASQWCCSVCGSLCYIMVREFQTFVSCLSCYVSHTLTDVYLCLQPAYSYSVENQTLTEALDKQQNRVHQIYSTIAGKKAAVSSLLLPADMTATEPGTEATCGFLKSIITHFGSKSNAYSTSQLSHFNMQCDV